VDADRLVPLLVGAVLGALGWLVVGLFLQRRQTARQAKSAGRAVYFELVVNGINVEVARDHGVYEPLGRAAYERLLPELATWLPAQDLMAVARAYMGHAGYGQLRLDQSVTAGPRSAALSALVNAHEAAIAVFRRRVFNPDELARMREAGDPLTHGGASVEAARDG
jgi:hypothetical protein